MRFSILIPFYNIEKYAVKCIESIINQNFTDFEVIAVDDGSTDSTGKILDNYAAKDNRIKVIHKKNGGLTSARKAAAEVCSAEYVVIVDGDDWIAENYLEKINEIILQNEVDVVITGYYEAFEDRNIERMPYKVNGKYGLISRDELETYYLPHLFSTKPIVWAKAFKRELYLKYQMQLSDEITMGEDGCISYPCIVESKSIFTICEPLYFYRQNPLSMTKHPKKYISWDNALARINHLQIVLPLEHFNLKLQISSNAAHAIFNVVSSHLKSTSIYREKKKFKKILEREDVSIWLKNAILSSDKKNSFLAIVLKHRLFLVIKLWSLLH